MKPIRVLNVVKKDGYEIRSEEYDGSEFGIGENIVLEMAYTPSGDYIGNPKDAKNLVEKYGIAPEKAAPTHSVCSIGWAERSQKYYGWSHRVICGFEVGHIVKEGDLTSSSGWTQEYLKEHPEKDLSLPIGFVAKTKDDCRRMAIAFAESVS